MLMLRLVSARRDQVHVDIQNLEGRRCLPRRDGIETEETGFFLRLPQRRRQNIRLAVRMAAELKPALKLSMMREENRP